MVHIVLVEYQNALLVQLVKHAWMAPTILLLRIVMQGLIVHLVRVPVNHVPLGPIVVQGHHSVVPVLWDIHVMILANLHRPVLLDNTGTMVLR